MFWNHWHDVGKLNIYLLDKRQCSSIKYLKCMSSVPESGILHEAKMSGLFFLSASFTAMWYSPCHRTPWLYSQIWPMLLLDTKTLRKRGQDPDRMEILVNRLYQPKRAGSFAHARKSLHNRIIYPYSKDHPNVPDKAQEDLETKPNLQVSQREIQM